MKKTYLNTIVWLVCLSLSFSLNAQHAVVVQMPDGESKTVSGDSTSYDFKSKVAEHKGEYGEAARLKILAIENNELQYVANAYYSATRYASLADNTDLAFQCLKNCLKSGYPYFDQLLYNADLDVLREDRRWRRIVGPYKRAYFKVNDQSVADMYHEDQRVRLAGNVDWEKLGPEDSLRRLAVLKLVSRGKLKSSYDYYKAAMIMHHGVESQDFAKAHELVLKSLQFEGEIHHPAAPWLAAASKDRYLLKTGQPQWYGTQLRFLEETGKIGIDPDQIDTTKVSAGQRKAWNAPSISKIRSYINNFLEAQKKRDEKSRAAVWVLENRP